MVWTSVNRQSLPIFGQSWIHCIVDINDKLGLLGHGPWCYCDVLHKRASHCRRNAMGWDWYSILPTFLEWYLFFRRNHICTYLIGSSLGSLCILRSRVQAVNAGRTRSRLPVGHPPDNSSTRIVFPFRIIGPKQRITQSKSSLSPFIRRVTILKIIATGNTRKSL